jgi:CRISPR-associated protein Cmr2
MRGIAMSDERSYFAITIGPIFESLMSASSPASLWAFSFLFSEISYELCYALHYELGLEIKSPYFDKNKIKQINASDDFYRTFSKGIGIFPDRIICKNDEQSLKQIADIQEQIPSIIEKVSCRYAVNSSSVEKGQAPQANDSVVQAINDYLTKYIQIHIISFKTDKNPIGFSATYLDAIELEQGFLTKESSNPLLDQFEYLSDSEDEKVGRSRRIKQCAMVTNLGDNWPLLAKGGKVIRDLESIANDDVINPAQSPMKKALYYAVLCADGDNMSALFKDEQRIDDVSKMFWDYSFEVAEKVKKYHGVPIYVGGDDLLALVPVENNEGTNILSLVEQIREVFSNNFSVAAKDAKNKEGTAPTISMGVCICYYKYPLYEALQQAFDNLHRAKYAKTKYKNTLAIHLQKHSGKSVSLYFKNHNNNECLNKAQSIIQLLASSSEAQTGRAAENFNTSISKLNAFQDIFTKALQVMNASGGTGTTWHNALDNIIEATPQHKEHIETLALLVNESACVTDMPTGSNLTTEKHQLAALCSLLRFIRFFVETGKEE